MEEFSTFVTEEQAEAALARMSPEGKKMLEENMPLTPDESIFPETIKDVKEILESQPLLDDEEPTCDAEPQAELYPEEGSESEEDGRPLTEEEIANNKAHQEFIAEQMRAAAEAERIQKLLYKNADFILECSCGHKNKIVENITGGMQYFVRAIPGETLPIQCEKCEHKFDLYFEEKPEIVEEVNDEQIPEENKEQE